MIRSQVLSLQERLFVDSARISGYTNYIQAYCSQYFAFILLYMTFAITGAILAEAGLSFIGLGDSTTVSWGMMLQWYYRARYVFRAPYWMLPPGICITLMSLSFYLIGLGTE